MIEATAVVDAPSLERAVFVAACEPGWDPRTVVRQLVWHEGHVHEELQVFPTLRDALKYAHEAFATTNGPLVSI